MSARSYDIIVFGATGYTGGLTVEYLARKAGPNVKWAIAGRSRHKLGAIRERLAEIDPHCSSVGIVEADLQDAGSLNEMAGQARVLITTVGPYLLHGEAVLRACIEEGTHYLDLTGEPEFVDLMLQRYGDIAKREKVRIINCCGFDSIPHDLGALFTVEKLREKMPDGGENMSPITVEGFVRARGTFSGGTWHSAVGAMARMREHATTRARQKVSGSPVTMAKAVKAKPGYRKELNSWAVPMPTIDPLIVRRSAKAMPEVYGAEFRYGHNLQIRKLRNLAVLGAGMGAVFALAQIKPTRSLLLKLRDPGVGPTAEQRQKGWFVVTMLGKSGTQSIRCEVRGGDPGYGETAKMLAESALCLIVDHDRLPESYGIITPAMAMGNVLIERLQHTGIVFEVVHDAN